MKPYIAILIDSFWEAINNRILWALLIGWTFVLIGVSPFGYISEQSYSLSNHDINNSEALFQKLTTAAKGGETSPAIAAISSKLEEPFREKLITESKKATDQRRRNLEIHELTNALNKVLESKGLYSEEAFPSAVRRERLKPLIEDEANLNKPDLIQLNRELLQIAMPLELSEIEPEKLWFGYAGFKMGDALPIGRRQIKQFVEPFVLSWIIKFGLGVITVFVALVVTSPIIPETFRSNSLHLLLSKPISRMWLFLFKFFGGCIFVLVNIAFLLTGLYFIAGIRFDIWNEGLLACIPLLLFVFMIFYSVSALVGLLWGNSIVSVIACILFWLFCLVLGAVHFVMNNFATVRPQISRIETVNGSLMTVNQAGNFQVWNEEFRVWQPGIEQNQGDQIRTFGPLYDANRNEIIVKRFSQDPFDPIPSRARRALSLIELGSKSTRAIESEGETAEKPAGEKIADQTDSLNVEDQLPKNIDEARAKPVWRFESGPELPQQVADLIMIKGDTIAVTRSGLYRLNWKNYDINKVGKSFLKFLPSLSDFEQVSPVATEDADDEDADKVPRFSITNNTSASPTRDGNGLIIYSSGRIWLLGYVEQKFVVQHTLEMEGEKSTPALVLADDEFSVVARDSQPIVIYKPGLVEPRSIELPADQNIRHIAWIPATKKFSVVTHLGDLFQVDCESGEVAIIRNAYSRKVTTVTWVDAQHVLLGVKPNRVVLLNLETGATEKSYYPELRTFEKVFNWAVHPIYLVNPKPAALDDAMSYILSGNKTASLDVVTVDMEQAQVEYDFWTPIISNIAFVVVMLTIACVYVARKEF